MDPIFNYRQAFPEDIPQLQRVRHLVKENVLTDPSKVTDEDCRQFISERGKGWVCEFQNVIVGFAIADLQENNIWALFVDPDFEGKGIGKKLHKLMLDWYFSTGKENAWLSTESGTRAAEFYRQQGWRETGAYGEEEILFEMTSLEWQKINRDF